MTKVAAEYGGLYGYRKATEKMCMSAVKRFQKSASRIASSAYKEDARVSEFLAIHAKRGKSRSAAILVEAMKGLGPKFASASKLSGQSMYGFPAKTARLGINACADLKFTAGEIGSGLHARKSDLHERISGFFSAHSKQGKCKYSRMLSGYYPESAMERQARFEEGKPADPTKNMSPEDAEEWDENTEKYKDKFTEDMAYEEFDASLDEHLARFEEGKPADPTKNMSPEDAEEWKGNTEKYKDKFKTARISLSAYDELLGNNPK